MAFGAEVNRATESAEYHRTFLIALITVRGELAACTTDSAFARAVKPSVDLYKNLRYVKQSLQNRALYNTKMRQFIKINNTELMKLTCLDASLFLPRSWCSI